LVENICPSHDFLMYIIFQGSLGASYKTFFILNLGNSDFVNFLFILFIYFLYTFYLQRCYDEINMDLQQIHEWATANGQKLNPEKSQVILIH
jgi:hypothetical protein